MPACNEAWIIRLTARAALLWCDHLLVLNHASTDRTQEYLEEIQKETGRLTIISDPDPLWREMFQRQRMLDEARRRGATHIALTDADELLTGNLLPEIKKRVLSIRPGHALITRMYCPWRGLEVYRHDDSVWSNRKDFSLAFADASNLAWRTRDGYEHHQRLPGQHLPLGFHCLNGGVMHLQWLSWRRVKAKHALYKMNERWRWPDKSIKRIDQDYSQALDESNLRTAPIPGEWLEPYRDWLKYIDYDHVPHQELECQRLLELHGREKFDGLNLFGIVC